MVLMTLASAGMLAILGVMVRREPHPHTIILALGGLAWAIGNGLWLFGLPLFRVVLWWIAFLTLTIAGERLELNRVFPLTLRQRLLYQGWVLILLLGTGIATFDLGTGSRLVGVALLGLAFWLLRFDLARRNLRHPQPLPRYIALCLCSGYLWLALAGGIFLYQGALYAGPVYDAALHAVFVGFVFSMIFGQFGKSLLSKIKSNLFLSFILSSFKTQPVKIVLSFEFSRRF